MKRGRPKKIVEVTEVKRGRGRPKKSEVVNSKIVMKVNEIVKKKRGRPRKETIVDHILSIEPVIDEVVKKKRGRPRKTEVTKPMENLVNDKVVLVDVTKDRDGVIGARISTGIHSFCPDCGVELTNIGIPDSDHDANCDTYGCPRCNVEVTKDNEITLHITSDGMKLDYNSLTITKLEE